MLGLASGNRRSRLCALASRAKVLLLCLTASACTHSPAKATLPANVTLTTLAQVDPNSPFAWAPSGQAVAFSRRGLRVTTLDGAERLLHGKSPTAIAWSPDGGRLAAAFADEGDDDFSVVLILDVAGAQQAKTRLEGRVRYMVWPKESPILLGAAQVKLFSFGCNFKSTLYRWNGREPPAATKLRDTTLSRPLADELGSRAADLFFVSLSPFGTEILYSQPVDPPRFPARLEIILRHLETGIERHLASVALMSSGAIFSADGERVLFGGSDGTSAWVDPWTSEKSPGFTATGWGLALSPSERYAWLDGHLFQDDRRVGRVPSAREARFSPGGRHLLALRGTSLLLLSGFREQSKAALDLETRGKFLSLRRWLFQDLISRDDYLVQKAKALKR